VLRHSAAPGGKGEEREDLFLGFEQTIFSQKTLTTNAISMTDFFCFVIISIRIAEELKLFLSLNSTKTTWSLRPRSGQFFKRIGKTSPTKTEGEGRGREEGRKGEGRKREEGKERVPTCHLSL
jgi:predicted secreted protein